MMTDAEMIACQEPERQLERLPQWALSDPLPSPARGSEDVPLTGTEGQPGSEKDTGRPSLVRSACCNPRWNGASPGARARNGSPIGLMNGAPG